MYVQLNCNSCQVLYLRDKAEVVIEEMASTLPASDVHKIMIGAGWELVNDFAFGEGTKFRIERWRKK